ncbi:MAG: M81 family metallopeptidase [Proteobacteria bacterium]|nr:M81 family metallopeptidase [Pseudomonadota bacterium]
MPRIAFGGIQHETNTFAPSQATYGDFERPDGWPALCEGADVFEAVAGINLPIAGFIEAARAQGFELLPLAWSSATPSAQVTEDAFERLVGDMMARLEALGPVDGVYLDLHGAMVAEHLEDGEGEVLRRVRALVGPGVPVVASLDLHANITPEMIDLADRLVAYRSYPHIDFADTGARAAGELDALLRGAGGTHKAFRQFPFLIPALGGCTLYQPAQGLYARLPELERRPGVDHVSLAMGFGPADIHHCGPSVCAYGTDQDAVEAAADALAGEILAREAEFLLPVWSPADGVARAIELAHGSSRPVILADSQDNPGGGGNGDTVGLLEELVRQGAEDAVLAILYDPEAAAAAHGAGEGAELSLGLGAKSGLAGHRPLEATYRVERLGDGRMTGTGPFYKGARMELGAMALLRLGGVRVVVASCKLQAADQSCFRHLGVEPAEQKILALKSSVHFRADFEPIAEDILVVAAPGPNPLDHNELTYKNLRPGVRVMPRGG